MLMLFHSYSSHIRMKLVSFSGTTIFIEQLWFQYRDDPPATGGAQRERGQQRAFSVRPAQRYAPLLWGAHCERQPRLLRTVSLAGGSPLHSVLLPSFVRPWWCKRASALWWHTCKLIVTIVMWLWVMMSMCMHGVLASMCMHWVTILMSMLSVIISLVFWLPCACAVRWGHCAFTRWSYNLSLIVLEFSLEVRTSVRMLSVMILTRILRWRYQSACSVWRYQCACSVWYRYTHAQCDDIDARSLCDDINARSQCDDIDKRMLSVVISMRVLCVMI